MKEIIKSWGVRECSVALALLFYRGMYRTKKLGRASVSVWSSSQLWSESTDCTLDRAACLIFMEEDKSPTLEYGTTLYCGISQVAPTVL